jgi:cysteine desulfurase
MIYLDYAATTPVDPRVIDAMRPYFFDSFGNPSSVHRYGQEAEAAVDSARETVAGVLNAAPDEIVFTSCGSVGTSRVARRWPYAEDGPVAHGVGALGTSDGRATKRTDSGSMAAVDTHGQVKSNRSPLRRIHCDGLGHAANKIGTVNPMAIRPPLTRGHPPAPDAVPGGCLPAVESRPGCGPALLIRHKSRPRRWSVMPVRYPLSHPGWRQEHGLRAGTQNVPYIIGFAEALRLAHEERALRTEQVRPLRDRIIGQILEEVPDSLLTGHPGDRLPNHASFVFRGVDGNLLLQLLDASGFACSSGSACKTGDPEPSEVITSLAFQDWAWFPAGHLNRTSPSG